MNAAIVTFQYAGLTLTADAHIEPYVPGRYSGPPEDCYDSYGGWAEIRTLKCGAADATFLLGSDWGGELNDACYDAWVAADKAEARDERYERQREEA